MSIRTRILIPMIIISILATSTILISNVMQFSSFVDDSIEDELERAVLKVIDEIEGLQMKAHTSVLYYANDNALIDAMDRGDHDAVLKRTEELYAETGVESLSVVDTNAITLARGHNLSYNGDDVSHLPIVRTALQGQATLGTVRGITTGITVRAASAVYNSQGQMIGALFAGDRLDSDNFVDGLKTFTGCEITVFIDDVRVATTLFNEDGVRATGSVFEGYTEQALLSGDGTTKRFSINNREIMEKHTLVRTSDGEVIGIVSVGTFLTKKHETLSSFVTTGILFSILFIVCSILLILFVARKIAAPIDQSIDQARYDDLTGVFNRGAFEEQFSILLKTLSRSGGAVSLMMIDIDFFKKYNDTYGHIKGDDCLKAVAAILTQTLARADDFVARYGGEEFVVVLPNTDGDGACLMAEKLLVGMRSCNIPHKESDVSDHVTISIGVTTGYANATLSSTDFIRQADLMLYESKRNGRNKYSYTPMP